MSDITAKEPIKILADIIQSEMELTDEQVMVYNQRSVIPTSEGLYIFLVLVEPGKVISNRSYFNNATQEEMQQMAVVQIIQINIMSANSEARQRCFEVLMALQSNYAIDQCFKYNISIAKSPANFIDASEAEGSAQINRYSTSVAVNCMYSKTKSIDVLDDFSNAEVHLNG